MSYVVFFIDDLCDIGDFELSCRRARVLPGVSFPSANADRFDDETGALELGSMDGLST